MASGGFGDQTGPQDPGQFGQGPFSGSQSGQAQYGQSQPQYGQPAGGYSQPQYGQAMPYGRVGRGTNSLAIAALCCGIGQVFAGPIAGIPAVILGFMSLGQIARTGEDGRGMAITGLVLGIVGLILTVLFIILFIAVWRHVTSSMVPAG
jgi:Domain of unknown function (DUF4190)